MLLVFLAKPAASNTEQNRNTVYLFGHGGREQEGASLSGNHLQDFIHLVRERKHTLTVSVSHYFC